MVLFERSHHLLPLQRQNTKRYLHPHLFDWPAAGSLNEQAELPLLNWKAGWSEAVAREIVRGFEDIVATTDNIHVRLGIGIDSVSAVPSADEARRIRILASEGEIHDIVDVAIIAVGFGLERRNRFGMDSRSYWEDRQSVLLGGRWARTSVGGFARSSPANSCFGRG